MVSNTSKADKEKGSYLLLLRLPRRTDLKFGARNISFTAGWYVYCGSAQAGLRGRIGRHLRVSRSGHWHIDGLLAESRVIDAQMRFAAASDEECSLAHEVSLWPEAVSITGFGSSDCRCPTHLFFFSARPSVSIRNRGVLQSLPEIYRCLRKNYQNQPMWDRDPFQTLIGCVLSLRTQDPVTEKAMKRLFEVYPEAVSMSRAKPEKIAELIYPVGMYNRKSHTLVEIANLLVERYNGRVPSDIESLTELPGAGRKTANLVRSFAFHLPALCVDTHVHRITNRWGLVRAPDPDRSEMELRRVLPAEYWIETNSQLVQHGQKICRPGKPRCEACGIAAHCLYPELLREKAVLEPLPEAPSHPGVKLHR